MSGHVPVMLREAVSFLAPKRGGIYLDATFGGGGYTRAILEATECTVFAIDRDPDAIARGAALLARYPGRLTLIEGRFGDLVDLLAAHGVASLDGAVFDFGLSSFQLDDPARGFSFRAEGPLDMRMGRSGRTAADLVNTLDEVELAALIRDYGEERHARRIARAIVRTRAEAPITTTARLADIVRSVVPRAADGIDPATRSFQALRIAVNEELDEIARGLAGAIDLLSPGGRIVAVSFHSLEDRIVKRLFADAAGRSPSPSRHDPRGLLSPAHPRLRLLTTKPVVPAADEIAANPRARSARLRAAEKLAEAA
ncbi:16S rRNA (cytosine(1402)-N(4))-methyltransferase RsmH [Elioraea thermophila]|uniref:16S rRNA (cytosine(1402)-N(4))-methyltransferase RsmH n=1 Tax=Elioraea thermophila TaxID=2185104 RepID=UPI0022B82B1E|nr:16S rRNA (cytosine(1402)-N(4))-methyltransferase RsmH [Elioraea thermophila]